MLFSNIMSHTATSTVLIPLGMAILPENATEVCMIIGLSASTALFLPVSTPPNAIAYYDAGGNITGDPLLTAIPVDQFGRPQIRDLRIAGPGQGAVWRNGAWQSDGDATNVTGEGYVTYGPAENGLQDIANGAFGRVKWNRFGIR